MADYEARHSVLLQKVEDKGAPISFTVGTAAEYDPRSDTTTESAIVLVVGQAVEIMGDPDEYAALELIQLSPITLFFVPNTYGELPVLNAQTVWAGQARSVRSIYPVRPAGIAIGARLILT